LQRELHQRLAKRLQVLLLQQLRRGECPSSYVVSFPKNTQQQGV
jgi:hypothetical protein